MNHFLASLEITFRRDPTNFRPRVNKLNSIKDREQKGRCFLDGFGQHVLTHENFSGGQLLLPRGVRVECVCIGGNVDEWIGKVIVQPFPYARS